MSEIKATIMIPAFNVDRFLVGTIESALNQTFNGTYEVLVVNDGSTDGTREIVEEYAGRNPDKVRAIHQENKGLGATRNVLLENSRGGFLLALDGDDELRPDALEKVVAFFGTHPDIGFVYTDQSEVDSNGELIRTRTRGELAPFFYDLIYHIQFAGHLRAFRGNQIRRFGFDSNLRRVEDWDFILKIFPFVDVAHIPEVLYDYRLNENGLTLTNEEATVQQSIRTVTKYLNLRRIYGWSPLEVVPVKIGPLTYYDHIVDGGSTMKPEARQVLEEHLRRDNKLLVGSDK